MYSAMKVQIGQKKLNFMKCRNHHNMEATYAYAQYLTFLVKCTKGNKIQKVALKIDKICIFFGQLPKCLIILLLIDV